MFTDLKPFLSDIDVHLVIKKKKDSEEFVLIVMPKPHRKCKDEALNKMPPFFLTGSLEEISKDWASEETRQRVSNFRKAVVAAGAFDAAIEKASKPKAEPKETTTKAAPKKKAAAKKEKEPEIPESVKKLNTVIEKCRKAVTDGDQAVAAASWKDVTAHIKLMMELGTEISEDHKTTLKALQADFKALPVQTSLLD